MNNLLTYAGLVAAFASVYLFSSFVYHIFFHPLRNFPGPKLWACTRIPFTYYKLSGTLPYNIKKLHEKYGDVVRITPSALSYTTAAAWEDIYGLSKPGKPGNFRKNIYERGIMRDLQTTTIMNAHGDDHRRIRRSQSHAFSEKALIAQEPILQDYARQFIEGLKTEAKRRSGIVAIGKWFNLTTFDLISDLAFGDSLGCVKAGELHPWIQSVFSLLEVSVWNMEGLHFPILNAITPFIFPKSILNILKEHMQKSSEKAERRMNRDTDRPDFMTYIMKSQDTENGMTRQEIRDNASVLLVAGSETTASSLTGLTWYLLKPENRHILDRLTNDIRSTFASQEDMTLQGLAAQKYLNAVLDEGLRIYPVVPGSMPRIVPQDGAIISGQFVPGNTTVSVHMMAAHFSESNFHNPESFVPERWLPSSSPNPYSNDILKARQPFSFGPANCIGINLARAELRLLLANLLWHFDVEAVKGEEDWLSRNRIFTLWIKPELSIKLSERRDMKA